MGQMSSARCPAKRQINLMDSSVENKVSKNMEKKKILVGEHDFKSVAASYLITVD